jgi:hypothetical protein
MPAKLPTPVVRVKYFRNYVQSCDGAAAPGSTLESSARTEQLRHDESREHELSSIRSEPKF